MGHTPFAQRAPKPQEVQRELDATDAVLGDPAAVRQFVRAAVQRLRLHIAPHPRRAAAFRINVSLNVSEEVRAVAPNAVRLALPQRKDGWWSVSFISPLP